MNSKMRKAKFTEKIFFGVSPGILEGLDRIADANEMSRAEAIRESLEDYIKKHTGVLND